MTVDDTLVQRPLYGGAAHLAFPHRFADISDFRPVPDHQEVRSLRFSWEKTARDLQLEASSWDPLPMQ